MAKANTTQATTVRQRVARDFVESFGERYFNPLIGATASETCANLSSVLQFLHSLSAQETTGKLDTEECQAGITLLLHTAWIAAQYEEFAAPHDEGGAK